MTIKKQFYNNFVFFKENKFKNRKTDGKKQCLFRWVKCGALISLATTEEVFDDEVVRVVKEPFKIREIKLEQYYREFEILDDKESEISKLIVEVVNTF